MDNSKDINYLRELFEVQLRGIASSIDKQGCQLEAILHQTQQTNGRVTRLEDAKGRYKPQFEELRFLVDQLEDRVVGLELKLVVLEDLRHRVSVLEVETRDVRWLERHPKFTLSLIFATIVLVGSGAWEGIKGFVKF